MPADVALGLADTAFVDEGKEGEHLARPGYLTSGKLTPTLEKMDDMDDLCLCFDTRSRGFRASSVADSELGAEREDEGAAQPGKE